MTSDNHISLSKYQRAMLTHLGIMPWQLKSNATNTSESQSADNIDCSSDNQQQTNASQQRREAGLEKLKEVVSTENKTPKQITSIQGEGLVLVEKNDDFSMFIIDVMQVVGLDAGKFHVVNPTKEHEYTNSKFLWSISKDTNKPQNDNLVEITGNSLTTAQLNDENVLVLKKQLWQILQNYTFQA